MMMEWFLASLFLVLVLWGIWSFNRLVRSRNLVRAAWSDVDVQLVRRHDLIPQLVAVVTGYAEHERNLLAAVAALRTQAIASNKLDNLAQLEDALEDKLGSIVLLQEAYPDLKADDNFRDLHTKLVETENLLQHARRFYNGAVRQLNNHVLQFPDLLIARLCGFTTADFFQAAADQRENISVHQQGSL